MYKLPVLNRRKIGELMYWISDRMKYMHAISGLVLCVSVIVFQTIGYIIHVYRKCIHTWRAGQRRFIPPPHFRLSFGFLFPEFSIFCIYFSCPVGRGGGGLWQLCGFVLFFHPQVILIFLSTFFFSFFALLSLKRLCIINRSDSARQQTQFNTLQKGRRWRNASNANPTTTSTGRCSPLDASVKSKRAKVKKNFSSFFGGGGGGGVGWQFSSQSSSYLSSIVAGVTHTYRRQTTHLNNNNNRERDVKKRRTNTLEIIAVQVASWIV